MANIASLVLCVSLALLSTVAHAQPSIETNGKDMNLQVPVNGDIKVSSPAESMSLFEMASNMVSFSSAQANNTNNILSLTKNLSIAVSQLESDIDVAKAAVIKSLLNNLTDSVTALNNSIIANTVAATNVSQMVSSVNTSLRSKINKKNPACIGDILTVVPSNTEVMRGSCDLSVGGTCSIGCKSGYTSMTTKNVAIGANALSNGNPLKTFIPNKTVDGVIGDVSRFVTGASNRIVWVAYDLAENQTGISQFRFIDGHTSCTPEKLAAQQCYRADVISMTYCKHQIQVWRGDPSTPFTEAAADLSSNSGWQTVVDYQQPSIHAEEHPVMNPRTWAQYVRLVVDNRFSKSCPPATRYVRLQEFEVLADSFQDWKCNEDGLSLVNQSANPIDCFPYNYIAMNFTV